MERNEEMMSLNDFLSLNNFKIGKPEIISFIDRNCIVNLKGKDDDKYQDYSLSKIIIMNTNQLPYVKLELIKNENDITIDKYMSITEAENLPVTLRFNNYSTIRNDL